MGWKKVDVIYKQIIGFFLMNTEGKQFTDCWVRMSFCHGIYFLKGNVSV